MFEVVEWISHELNFDRLYFYGESLANSHKLFSAEMRKNIFNANKEQ